MIRARERELSWGVLSVTVGEVVVDVEISENQGGLGGGGEYGVWSKRAGVIGEVTVVGIQD